MQVITLVKEIHPSRPWQRSGRELATSAVRFRTKALGTQTRVTDQLLEVVVFNIILWALTHYQARPLELRKDKRGIEFVSAQFEWPPKQWATDYFPEDHPFTFWVKSLAIYTTKKGRYLLLANIGGINENGKVWSSTTRLVIKPNQHSWTVFEKGKYKGTLYINRIHLAWQEMLPLQSAPTWPSIDCECKACSIDYAWEKADRARREAELPSCTCDECTPF